MLSQILKTSLFVIFLGLSCKQDKFSRQNILKNQNVQKFKDTVVNILHNKDYYLKIETHLLEDTLDVVDYKEDKYSSPIITYQSLFFYKYKKLIKKYRLPIKNINRKTIKDKILRVAETPVYQICISNNFYIVSGSDYCNGSDCPEFIGIYNMDGVIIYEGLSNKQHKSLLKDILFKHKINLNNLVNCINIEIHKKI